MSRFVQRCQGAHCGNRVLGKTSFRSLGNGVRATVCRFCEDADLRIAKERDRLRRRKLKPIEDRISSLRMRLGTLQRRKLQVILEIERAS